MSVAADATNTRVRISDPRPAYCSACFTAAQDGVEFVDFDAALDTGAFVDGLGSYVTGSDDLHLCEACVRAAAEALAYKPQRNARQLQEIRRLELENGHWKDYAKRMEALVKDRPEPVQRG